MPAATTPAADDPAVDRTPLEQALTAPGRRALVPPLVLVVLPNAVRAPADRTELIRVARVANRSGVCGAIFVGQAKALAR